ncbi:hypothetical protein [Alkaliphilus peptidifermentans]|nr:hypothetical protein [Alkaliphilus peptidifermentans]
MIKEKKPLKEKMYSRQKQWNNGKAEDAYKVLLENRKKRKEDIKMCLNR